MNKKSVCVCRIVGVAAGLMVVAGAATSSSAATIMAVPFDESPQPTNTPLPFQTADISGRENHIYIHDLAASATRRPFDQSTAFDIILNPIATQFSPESGVGNGPAGPFGDGPGHFIGVHGDYIELTPPGTPGETPNNDLTFTNDFTIEFWFRTGEQAFMMFALGDNPAVTNSIMIFMQGGAGPGKVSANVNAWQSEGPFLLSEKNIYSNWEWHHVALVRDTTAETASLILDGGADAGGETITDTVDPSWTFNEPYGWMYRLNGRGDNSALSIVSYDELRISDVALAESELGFFGTIVPQPISISGIAQSNGMVEVLFENLNSGSGYDVETTDDLTCDGCWSNVLSFTAAGTSTNITFAAVDASEAYRLAEQ